MKKTIPAPRSVFLGGVLLLTACSGQQQDVRETLCQQLAGQWLFSDLQRDDWQQTESIFNGYEDLQVRVSYSMKDSGGEDSAGNFSCYYAYETVEENAMTQADPASAYATYPSRVSHNGQTLERAWMADAVNKALLSQGRKAVDDSLETLSGVKTQ